MSKPPFQLEYVTETERRPDDDELTSTKVLNLDVVSIAR